MNDFDNLSNQVLAFSTEGDASGIIWALPFIAAFIGWFTNFLAVKMLFHPRTAFSFLGIQVQGIFPKRQKQLAEKLGELVANELLSTKQITEKIRSHATSEASMKIVSQSIEKTIRGKLVQAFPMLSMFLSDDMIAKATKLFEEEIKEFLVNSIDELNDRLESQLNVKKMVTKKVEAFSSEKIEELLVRLMKKEFKFIEMIGAFIGFVIGCVQILIAL